MRYAVVIEDAGGNYSAYVLTFPVAWQRARPLKRQKLRSARRSNFISTECARTALPFLSRRAESTKSK